MKTKRQRFWMTAIMASIFMAIYIGGCKKDDFVEIPGVCPAVVSTNPTNGAISVPLNQVITATFNEAMNPATITQTAFTLTGGEKATVPVEGTLSYNEINATLSFAPTALLVSNTTYTGTIRTSVKDLKGNALQTNYVWTFSTGSTLSPTVISTDPANNAIGVFINKVVTATFSVPMNPSTINATTFTLKHGTTSVEGIVSYDGITASFISSDDLASNTIYTGTITTGSKNVAGTPLENDYIWTFTTGSLIGPSVISTDPTNNAVGVTLDKTVTATFSVPMDPLTINTTTFILKQGLTTIEGIISYEDNTASFNPSSPLIPGTLYVASITTGAKNITGTPLANNYVWSFTTGSLTSPGVVSTDPANNAAGVALNKIVTATFNMPMNEVTINTATFAIAKGTTSIAGVVSFAGMTATFIPSTDFIANTIYTGTITTGAENLAGVTLTNNYVWTFTTGSTASVPIVTSTDPANNATDVALDKIVTATFNMPMDELTLNALTYTLMQGSTPVTGIISYSGLTASFVPFGGLLAGTTYTAMISTGAQNIAGNPLANNYEWSFTTQAETIPTIDLGTASIFGAFGGNAGITNQGLNTIINGAISTTAASTLVTGFHDGLTGDVYTETPLNTGLVTNGIYTAPPFPGTATSEAIATLALIDANAAYISISPASMPGGIDPGDGELGGLTLAPGIYKSASGTFNISNGPLTLDAQGDPNATWVFQTAAGLTVGIAGPTGARSIIMTNGALPQNVYWYVGSAATINGAGGGTMVGTIIATAGVTFSTPGNAVQTVLNGRAISLIASVTMVNTTINVPAR